MSLLLSVSVITANGNELTLGSTKAGGSKTRVIDWKAPILDAVRAGDSSSLRTMYHEAKHSSHPRTKFPTADDVSNPVPLEQTFIYLTPSERINTRCVASITCNEKL